MEQGRWGSRGSKAFGTDKLIPWTNLCLSVCFQTTKAFLPKMLELNHGHIVTVASSLGLFSTAGVEVRTIHTALHYSSHQMKLLQSEPEAHWGRVRVPHWKQASEWADRDIFIVALWKPNIQNSLHSSIVKDPFFFLKDFWTTSCFLYHLNFYENILEPSFLFPTAWAAESSNSFLFIFFVFFFFNILCLGEVSCSLSADKAGVYCCQCVCLFIFILLTCFDDQAVLC